MPNLFANVLRRVSVDRAAQALTETTATGTAVLTAPNEPAENPGDRSSSGLRALYQQAMSRGEAMYFFSPGGAPQQMRAASNVPDWPWSAGGYGQSYLDRMLSDPSIFGTDTASAARMAAQMAAPRAVVEEPPRSMLKRVEPLDLDEIAAIDLEDEDRQLAIEAEAVLGYRVLREKMQIPGLLRRTLDRLEIPVLDQASVDAYKAQMVAHYETTNKMAMPTWRLTSLENYTQEIPKFALRKAAQIKRELPEAEIYIDQLAIDPFLIVSFGVLKDWMSNQPTRNLNPETQAYIEVWGEPKFEATL